MTIKPNDDNLATAPEEQITTTENLETSIEAEDFEHIGGGESNQPEEQEDRVTVRSYKIVCAKLGLIMCVYFVCRLFPNRLVTDLL